MPYFFKNILNRFLTVACSVCVMCVPAGVFFGESRFDASGSIKVGIEAKNESSEKQNKKVRYYLPPDVGPENIMDYGGFELGQDATSGELYLENHVTFEANEIKNFNVTIKNIWVIPGETVKKYDTQALTLRAKLSATDGSELADILYRKIKRNIDLLRSSSGGDADDLEGYIANYKQNKNRLSEIIGDLAQLEKLKNEIEKRSDRAGSILRSFRMLILVVVVFLVIFSVFLYKALKG